MACNLHALIWCRNRCLLCILSVESDNIMIRPSNEQKSTFKISIFLGGWNLLFRYINNHIIQSRMRRASSPRRPTTSWTCSPHTSIGRALSIPSLGKHNFACLSASASSITTQLSALSGLVRFHLISVGREGTSCGGITERPLCKSSNMKATSSSSIGSLLDRCRHSGWCVNLLWLTWFVRQPF